MNKHNRLINAILNGSQDLLSAPDTNPEKEQLLSLYQMIASHEITNQTWADLIANLPSNVTDQNLLSIHDQLAEDSHTRHILAYMSGVGFDKYEDTTEESLETFLERFKNPADFDLVQTDFLNAIKRSQEPDEAKAYEQAIKVFRQAVYGEKEAFWQAVHDIDTEYRDYRAEGLSAEFTKNAIIEGDPWPQGDKEYTLTPELLKSVGLGPRHEITLDHLHIALSDSFIAEGRDAIIAYVKYEDEIKIRSYYRSNAQGMWRYLPDYVAEDGKITLFGRGYHQETMILPSKLQKKLSHINAHYTIEDHPGTNMTFFLAGTAKRYSNKEEYQEKRDKGELSGAAYEEISEEPIINFGERNDKKHAPESVDIDGEDSPNFRHEVDRYKISSNLYGDVTVKQFYSYNEKISYLICEITEQNARRAWIGNIESKSPYTSTGLSSEWISSGDLVTPLYEHADRDGGFGNPKDRKGRYIGMWDNYLSHTPIIKRYFYSDHSSR